MTRISEVHGLKNIPANEFAGRGAEIKKPAYVPYLSLTKGQMELSLLKQRADILAQFYGKDRPQYAEASKMIANALHVGLHGYKFMGAIPDVLQGVAAAIEKAKWQTAPASRSLFAPPAKIGQIIPIEERRKACWEAAGNDMFKRNKCNQAFEIEKILNDGLEKSGHHMLYKSLPGAYSYPQDVRTKKIFHNTGVDGLANAGNIDADLMTAWVENGIMLVNAQNGIGPIGSVISSLHLAQDPGAELKSFLTWAGPSASKWTQGGINGIGITIDAVVAALLGILKWVINMAKKLLEFLRSAKAFAMSEARGFGTKAFNAGQDDWILRQSNPQTTGANPLLYLLLGGAALLLLKE